MTRVEFILYKGARILDLDVRGTKDVDQYIAAFRLAKDLGTKEPLKSVRLLTDVTDAHYTSEVVSAMKELSRAGTPYIKASAAVGITGMRWIILQSLIRLTGREIKLFDTREKALEWLSGQ